MTKLCGIKIDFKDYPIKKLPKFSAILAVVLVDSLEPDTMIKKLVTRCSYSHKRVTKVLIS